MRKIWVQNDEISAIWNDKKFQPQNDGKTWALKSWVSEILNDKNVSNYEKFEISNKKNISVRIIPNLSIEMI